MPPLLLALALALALPAATARAHHSIAGAYDSSRPATVEGVVIRFHFINPHPFITVAVAGSDGRAGEWQLEMDNRRELAAVGMTTDTLRLGDRVVVTGSQSRTQPQSLYIRRLERPADGFQYEQVGSSPRIRRPSR